MIRVAAALVGIYIVGMAIGAVLASLTRGPADAGTAFVSPSPSPAPPSAATSSPAPTVSPVVTPTVQATVPLTNGPPATVVPSDTPAPSFTPAPTPSPEPSPMASEPPLGADPEQIPAFVVDLASAIDRGADRFLIRHLHPAVIERYGQRACRSYTSTTRIEGLRFEHVGADGPARWDWVLDGVTTPIPDAWTVTVVWRQPDLEEQRDFHIAPADGTWRWFTDCGDPL